ncbi:MAG: hypothetical protein K6G07_07070 [Lachnospiraceae bacterium]|nr:hypothetical protein [Lachnospiraceae bacterium]
MLNAREALQVLKKETGIDSFYAYNDLEDVFIFCKGDPVFWYSVHKDTGKIELINRNEILVGQLFFNKKMPYDIDLLNEAIRNAKDISEI